MKDKAITPDQVALLNRCAVLSDEDMADFGLLNDPNLDDAHTIQDLLELFEGVDSEGRAL